MGLELKVPEVGESITEVEIGRWLKGAGEAVKKDEPIVEIETDKVTVELPAPSDGVVGEQVKKQGDQAKVGEVIGYLDENGQAAAEKGKSAEKGTSAEKGEQAKQSQGAAKPQAVGESGESQPSSKASAKPQAADGAGKSTAGAEQELRIMPAAQRLMDEYGVRPEQVEPTGPGGRVLKQDVLKHLEQREEVQQRVEQQTAPPAAEPREAEEPTATAASAAAAPASTDGEPGREEEVVPMSPMRRRIAQRLVEAQQNAAMLTTFNEVDMQAVMDLRNRYKETFEKRYGVRLGFMSFFVKAAIDALKQYPAVNAEIRGQDIVYKNYYDIGIAVSTERGLVVPVLRNTERKSFAEIEVAIGDFGKRARDNKLQLDELTGGTFTITNGGVFGSLMSTPILNPPQSGVLGMHAIQQRAVVVDGEVKVRPMMYVALTYDHRIIDGREAVSFLRRLKEAVEEPSRMLVEI